MILNIILSVICGLIIIGCIFIFFRVSKIRAHLNEKRLSLGIKFPFYLAITCINNHVPLFIISYLIGGIFHVILFIKNEGFLFNPDTIVRQEKAQQINDPETGIISPVENGQEYSLTETVSE
ncbi:hypothetical protein RhiirA5_464042 [Rhizophagus irregularis]|uniref:Uncharacterized protein n=1 Tax=Rhizophagus irregularis TaxID=588596 RepID=A0A2N0S6H3_9GLOM|nr:hypothetical protein RhiirA5_464042 [Rhizophagus irregularis]PKC71117.1 hypothetical protein RhiirA1_439060 [Rhizophagus irregularis]